MFGIEIERKTDILAFAAFLISISTLITQIYYFVEGPNVCIQEPKVIVLYKNVQNKPALCKNYNGKISYLEIILPMTYINNGYPGYHDILTYEEVILKIGKIKYFFQWYRFIESYDDPKKNFLIMDENKSGVAKAKQIQARNVVHHETLFTPILNSEMKDCERYSNFLLWDNLIKQTKNEKQIFITIISKFSNGRAIQTECVMRLSDDVKSCMNSNVDHICQPLILNK